MDYEREQLTRVPAVINQPRDVTVADMMPLFDHEQAAARRNAMVKFVKDIMIDGTDFGTIPGTNKPSLLKPGAEKLVTFFGLSPEFTVEGCAEDWTGEQHAKEPFFYYRYRCRLTRNGRLIGEGEGSCNSWESKYRYRWVPEDQIPAHLDKAKLSMRGSSITEFAFAIDKAETGGPYGKPAEYWQQFRDALNNKTAVETTRKTKAGKELPAYSIPRVTYQVPNKDVADVVNTVQKMAQKRALVAAVLVGVNASEFFTQDVEDMEIIDVTPITVTSSAARTTDTRNAGGDTSRAPTGAHHAGESASAERQPGDNDEPPPLGEPRSTDSAELQARLDSIDEEEAEMLLAINEIDNMGTLTKKFNDFPQEKKKVGGAVHKAFKARMELLTERARYKSQQRQQEKQS